jgi:predicted RNA-binding protein with TRAM domain
LGTVRFDDDLSGCTTIDGVGVGVLGETGAALAEVGPGYVVFVSDTEVGQHPLVRITAARENVAFVDVVDR